MLSIDTARDALITAFGHTTLRDRYLIPGEDSPQQAFARAAMAYADNEAHGQRLYEYVSKQWFMFSTPILSNGGTNRGLPISCFLTHVPDSREGITDHYTECSWLSSVGGGIGTDFSSIRSNGQRTSRGSSSSGLMPFIKPMDSIIIAFSQGDTRRGSYAAYVRIDHPEIEEFIAMRKPQGGDPNRKTLNLNHGLLVSDAFMQIIERCLTDRSANDDWPLIDPHSKQVVKVLSARALWRSVIETRIETGEPYLMFTDTINRTVPEEQTRLGVSFRASNLCTEITQGTGPDKYGRNRTAVCCLSSVNLAKYNEWGGADCELFVDDLLRMLDNALSQFISDAPPALRDAAYGAARERSVGLGAMGFHTWLQANDIPMDSPGAAMWNEVMFRRLRQFAAKTNRALALERGPCPDSAEGGDGAKRFMHALAVAPNASSSIICGGVSPGIEPARANAYTAKTLSGSSFTKNPVLQTLLASMDRDTDEVWSDIVTNKGSVQHLDFLTDHQKNVFRTAMEIDQMVLVKLAAQRAPHICQASSTNLFFAAGSHVSRVVKAHMAAWKLGVKSLYYCRSESIRSVEKIVKTTVSVEKPVDLTDMHSLVNEGCLACQ